MLGTFNNDQPKVEITITGVNGTPKTLYGLIDSGFNGYLQIPFQDAFPLGLVLEGLQATTLANGSQATHLVCKGKVTMDGKTVETTIDVESANIILIGTKLLKKLDKVFILDCGTGNVEIKDRMKS